MAALHRIKEIYHRHHGVDGYRTMKIYLEREGFVLSNLTIHKYMNIELGLRSIVRPKQPKLGHGEAHKVFGNKLDQNFGAEGRSQKCCTDFTDLFLKDGSVRYNCSILDLYDRGIVAGMTDLHINSDLAVRTLQKALDSQPGLSGGLILHSDQGAQYTSKAFTEYCKPVRATQSMGKAGYPYDNAPYGKVLQYFEK